jgi:hypothetical protein
MMFNEESIATRLKLKIGGLTLTNVDKLDLKEVNTIFRRMPSSKVDTNLPKHEEVGWSV